MVWFGFRFWVNPKFKVYRADFELINCWFIKSNLDLELVLFVSRFVNWPLVIVGLKLELGFQTCFIYILIFYAIKFLFLFGGLTFVYCLLQFFFFFKSVVDMPNAKFTSQYLNSYPLFFISCLFLMIFMVIGVPNGGLKYVFKFQRQLNKKKVRREWTCLKNKMLEKKSLKGLNPI